jgi:hypothetical protein
MDFDIRYRSVGEWNIAIHRSPLMAVLWDLFLLISGRQTSFSDLCACARLIADRTTYGPLKRDCVWSLTGGSATRRCTLWNDQRTGHFANQYFSLSLSLSRTHARTHTHTHKCQEPCIVTCHELLYQRESFCCGLLKARVSTGRLPGHTPSAVWAQEPVRIICTVKNLLSLPGLEPCSLVSIPT